MKRTILVGSLLLITSLFSEDNLNPVSEQIKNDMNLIKPVGIAPSNVIIPNDSNKNEFADSLASKIDLKLQNITRQIEEAQQIRSSSLNIPNSQLLDEKRAEQFLPVMTGGYEIKYKNSSKSLEKKALGIDEKGQKYYLTMNNNEIVKGISDDYLVYKNSESNKTFKSPLALPNKSEEMKISSVDTINSITPIMQDMKLPPLNMAVKEELKNLSN